MKKIIALMMILCLALVGCGQNDNVSEKISVRLPVPIMGAHFTQYFATVDQGYYNDEGLEVSFEFGNPEANPIKMVAAGVDDIGLIGSPESVLVARSKGLPVKAIATFHKDSDFFVLVTRKDSGIQKVEDLDGKKVGFFYGHSSTDILRHWFKKEGVEVEEVNVGQDYSQLSAGRLDAQFAFRTIAEVVLPAKGMDLNIISPREDGIKTHGLTLFALEQTIEEKPELIEKFLRATFKGTQYTLDNKDEALQSILKRAPTLKYEPQRKQLEMFTQPMSREIGHMDYGMYKESYDRLMEAGLLENEFDVSEAYTTFFLDKIYGKKEISMRLPIPVVDAGLTPFYVAVDKGMYEGLDVSLELGNTELNPIKTVVSGEDEFGIIGGPDTLLVARSKGQPVVAIASVHRDSDFPVLLTLKDSGLTEVDDLEGKTIGMFYGHISTDVLRNLLRKEEVNYEEVNVGFDYSQLIARNIDAQWAFRTAGGLNLPAKGIEVNVISPKDYGIRTHGLTLFTTEEVIENSPELVERIVRGTLRGMKFSVENPEEALKHTLKRDEKLSPELELEKLSLDNEVTNIGGDMDFQMFKETYDRLVEEEVIEDEFDVNEAFTTRFLND